MTIDPNVERISLDWSSTEAELQKKPSETSDKVIKFIADNPDKISWFKAHKVEYDTLLKNYNIVKNTWNLKEQIKAAAEKLQAQSPEELEAQVLDISNCEKTLACLKKFFEADYKRL
jgi:hypothetical protein